MTASRLSGCCDFPVAKFSIGALVLFLKGPEFYRRLRRWTRIQKKRQGAGAVRDADARYITG
jgi:hypothetical protein